MKRRTKIRAVSFAVVFAVCTLAWGISETVIAKNYERQISNSRQRALTEFTEYLNGMETALTKSMYAKSGKMLGSLTEDLARQSTGAKTSLSVLSTGDTRSFNLYKFLSQVSDYTRSLNLKTGRGESISAEDRRVLAGLLGYSEELTKQFAYITDMMNSGYLSFEELDESIVNADASGESALSFITAAGDAEESLADYPSLIYDGPFSDNILNKESVLLKNEKTVSRTAARKKAADVLNTSEDRLAFEGESEGKTASYIFRRGDSRIAITKKGGLVLYIIGESSEGEEKLTSADCVEKASAFLFDCGYKGTVSTYYSAYDGVCTVNFAYMNGNYICYPDLIKVGVSLTDGQIVSLEATDYIMNHTARDIPEPKISCADAAKQVSENLTVKRGYYAVIPTDEGGESYVYELLCEDSDGRDVLVYVDTVTGETDDILILLYSDSGTLTK